MKEWDQATVPWLDELYDLSARMEFHEGFRVRVLNMSSLHEGVWTNKLDQPKVQVVDSSRPNWRLPLIADGPNAKGAPSVDPVKVSQEGRVLCKAVTSGPYCGCFER